MPLMMATDASRVRLAESGVWSCRMKRPAPAPAIQLPSDINRAATDNNSQFEFTTSLDTMNMDVPLQSPSPSSRRNKGKIAEAIQNMGNLNGNMEVLELPTDPDAQATVTDFLDFTEYLPSDINRSLNLISLLDQNYISTSASVHDLTKIYGDMPNFPVGGKPNPVSLRRDISETLGYATGYRIKAHAEARRMSDNVDRHYNRAKNILAKLQAMADNYPPSREASPVPTAKSPSATRAPKITLRLVEGSRASASGPDGGPRVRKHRAPRITVPGEVLAPYELDYESYGSDSDESTTDEDEIITPRATPGVKLDLKALKKSKKKKSDNAIRPPRPSRPPGTGTNVHSALAGISTSNALALLKPPPPDAVKGDEHLPWLALNAWELALLRKRMKKNAIWSPSDTMIARELKQLGRGIEAYRAAKAEAEATGQPLNNPEPPQLRGETVPGEGAISVEALKLNESQLSNRGMKLNEAKKLKREIQQKELEKSQAATEESVRKIGNAAEFMKGLFPQSPDKGKKTNAKTPRKTPARKRKRDTIGEESDTEKADGEKTARPPLKRNKTETPVPAPQATTTNQLSPVFPPDSAPSVTSEPATLATPGEGPSEGSLAAAIIPMSPKKSTTPILPPTRDRKKPVIKTIQNTETAANSRSRRTSNGAPTPTTPTLSEAPLPAKRPTSSRSKAASVEPLANGTATIDRPRRASTARNTPAPETRQTSSKRAKRPAPGIVTNSSEGSAAVSIGKRNSATRKKAGPKKECKTGREGSANQQEVFDEVDDEGNLIPADEPRYCDCNRVSFGTMIGCENDACEKEWFHLECVGLKEIPARTTKWYCPQCRVALNLGQKGEVNARGKKR